VIKDGGDQPNVVPSHASVWFYFREQDYDRVMELFETAKRIAQGAALMFARVLSVWIDDEEEGLDRTMAALDRGLNSAERWAAFLDDLCALPKCILRGPRRRRRRMRDDEEAEAA
jgi:metal-dependent amidase/aminoacylase/carboxypeptidase family protein